MKISRELRQKCGIYQIYNTVTGKSYIGSSKNVQKRLQAHRSIFRGNYHTNPILQNSWNKYGEDSFECKLLCECSPSELTSKEQEYIDAIQPEYNITTEVIRNTPSEASRQKMSETAKYQWSNGIRVSATNKAVNQYDIYGMYIQTFDSVEIAAKDVGCHRCTIDRVTSGEKIIGNGYQWRLVEDKRPVVDVSKIRAGKVALFKLGELTGNSRDGQSAAKHSLR
jgi:hypothetical protein